MDDRDEFEAWCKSIGYCLLKDDDGRYKPGYGLELISPFIAGWQAARAKPVVPEGYVLVPVEPTEEMLYQGMRTAISQNGEPWLPPCYKAMLAAAPKQERQHAPEP